jgi:translation elongation factor EF-1alpha
MDAVKYDQAKYDEAVAAMKKLFAMIGNKAERSPSTSMT